MKVLFLTIGTETMASSRTRVYQYLPYLRKAGIESVVVSMSSELKESRFRVWTLIRRMINRGMKYGRVLVLALVCDVIFIQKVLLPILIQKVIKTLNKNVIFDFDDAIYVLPHYCNSLNDSQQRHALEHSIQMAKGVVIENKHTEEFALQFDKDVLMITGPVDCKRYRVKERVKDERNIVVGWIGSPTTTPYLEPLFTVFKRIYEEYSNVVVGLIGASPLEIEGVRVVSKEWNLDTEVANLHDFDIGIMPLPDDEWTRGKGGYKLLQYMAVGIPCVASPVGINSILVREGINGYLADSEEQWYEKLEMLIRDGGLRKKIGANGRKIVEKQYSVEVGVPKLVKFLKEVASK